MKYEDLTEEQKERLRNSEAFKNLMKADNAYRQSILNDTIEREKKINSVLELIREYGGYRESAGGYWATFNSSNARNDEDCADNCLEEIKKLLDGLIK